MSVKVLIVEDNEMNLFVINGVLQHAGVETLSAADGESAVLMARECRPDVILMDLQLPVLNGYEATRRIKAAPETADIKVMALTAYALDGDREAALAAGCDEYLAKPIDTGTFPEIVRRFAGERG